MITQVDGSTTLNKLKSVQKLAKKNGDNPLLENEPLDPKNIVQLRKGLKQLQVIEGQF